MTKRRIYAGIHALTSSILSEGMMQARQIGMLGFVLSALVASLPAGAGECSREDEAKADASIDRLDGWKDIYAAYKSFKRCDDGAIAEGYSDGVAKQMANHWDRLPELLTLTRADPPFEAWVVRHLDETNALDDSLKIYTLSKMACPGNARELCSKIQTNMRESACLPDHPGGVGCIARRDGDRK